MDVENYKLFRHARKLKVEKIISSLVEMEDISVEKVALILCKLYKEEVDDAIFEAWKRRNSTLFLVALEIAKKMRYKIFKSTLLRHIAEGTDQEFLSEYDEGTLPVRLAVTIAPSRGRRLTGKQRKERDIIYNAIFKLMPPNDAQLAIEKIKDPSISTEQAAEIIKQYIEKDEEVVSLRSLLNMSKLSLSVSHNEEDRQLATKIGAALDIVDQKEKVIRPIDHKEENHQ